MSRIQFGVVAVLLAVIAATQAVPLLVPGAVAPPYEYKIEDISDRSLVDTMRKRGETGWDLVFARRATGDTDGAAYEVIFKRPL